MSSPPKITIDTGIEPPAPRPTFKKFIDKLEVGESFRVPIESWASIRNAAGNANRASNKKFTVQKVSEQIRKGSKKLSDYARIWRTK